MGLSIYNEEVKKWGQAHTQGAWVFVQFLLENQLEGQEILTIQFDEEKKTFHLTLNKYYIIIIFRDMLLCYGQDIVSRILTPIHIWRCTGNSNEAREFFNKYSSVNDYFLKIRKVILETEVPRRLELNHNLKIDSNCNVTLEEYPLTPEGIINSFIHR